MPSWQSQEAPLVSTPHPLALRTSGYPALTNYRKKPYHPKTFESQGRFLYLLPILSSSPLRRNSPCECAAPQRALSRTLPHPQTHAELPAASFTPHCLAVVRTHFLFLSTGSRNEIVSAKSNHKRWVNDSRKLVQVLLRLETERRKICSISTVFTLPTVWNRPLIFF